MVNGKRDFPQQKGGREKQEQQEDKILARITEVSSFVQIRPSEYALPGGFAEDIAKTEKDMKTTQLRKFFTKIKNLENKLQGKNENEKLNDGFKSEIYLIIPELAYSKGRGLIKQRFFEIIVTTIREKLQTVGDYRNFSRFVTAIVAYKKAHGG